MAQAYINVLRVTVLLISTSLIWACSSTAEPAPGGAFMNFSWKPCDVASPSAGQEHPYTGAPLGADALWSKVLLLLNEHDGYVSPKRYADVLGAQFGVIDHSNSGASCRVRPGTDWYFSGYVDINTEPFKVPGTAVVDHVAWNITWGKDAFGGRCISAARAQADLLAAGWTAPWKEWGRWEKLQAARNADPIHCSPQQVCIVEMLPRPPIWFSFGRPGAKDGATWALHPALPAGHLYSTGDLPDSCVTGIEMDSRP